MPLLRVPYTDPLPLPRIIPASATSTSGAIAALLEFLAPSLPTSTVPRSSISSKLTTSAKGVKEHGHTLLLTGAGISVASGLADYRGKNGTYTLNKTYKPIYYNEFCENHEARKRYWARSFLGWTNLDRARPNNAHRACADLGSMGVVGSVITQNVDSFHPSAHPSLPTIELHGYLRALTCLTCRNEYPRAAFQSHLARLNPTWSSFLDQILASGALATENPVERRQKGLNANPDGDVDVPGAPYSTFRYPACPTCLAAQPPRDATGARRVVVNTDGDGAWMPGSPAGVLKPAVVMFGESIPAATKAAAERAVDAAGRILVVGSSLATYSAWRLVKRAKERGMPIGVVNVGGARGEESFFGDGLGGHGAEALRISEDAEEVLPQVVRLLRREM